MESREFIALRFAGNGVNPGTTRCRETAAIIRAAEDMVLAIIADYDDEEDSEEPLGELCVTNIVDESLGYRFWGPRMPAILLAWQIVAAAINTGSFEKIPLKARESLGEIAAFVKKRGAPAQLTDSNNAEPIAQIKTDFCLPHNLSLKGGTSVLGKVVRVGGKEPKLRLQLPSGKVLTCETSEPIAKELGHKLYETVVCKGEATWELESNEIIKFRIKEVKPFRQCLASEAFNGLARAMPLTLERWRSEGIDNLTIASES